MRETEGASRYLQQRWNSDRDLRSGSDSGMKLRNISDMNRDERDISRLRISRYFNA